jgi:hypothetical protein
MPAEKLIDSSGPRAPKPALAEPGELGASWRVALVGPTVVAD